MLLQIRPVGSLISLPSHHSCLKLRMDHGAGSIKARGVTVNPPIICLALRASSCINGRSTNWTRVIQFYCLALGCQQTRKDH